MTLKEIQLSSARHLDDLYKQIVNEMIKIHLKLQQALFHLDQAGDNDELKYVKQSVQTASELLDEFLERKC